MQGVISWCLAVALAAGVGAGALRAGVVADYRFDGDTFASFDADGRSSATDLTPGAGFSAAFVAGNPGRAIEVDGNETAGSEADSRSGNKSYKFTLTPGDGYVMLIQGV